MSVDGDDNAGPSDDEGGMPEEEVSAILFSIDAGLVLMEDDTWVSREDAVDLLGEEETRALIADNEVQFKDWRRRQGLEDLTDYEAELNDFVDGCTQEEATARLKQMMVWSADATAEEIAAALTEQPTRSD